MNQPWRYACASAIGVSHLRSEAPCQDVFTCTVFGHGEDTLLVAAVSDGAGSATRSEVGAQLACDLFIGHVRSHMEGGGTEQSFDSSFAHTWLSNFRSEVGAMAIAEGIDPSQFACTFLAAIVGARASHYFQIGDGAIVVSPRNEPDEYCWIFWPCKGEYENQTSFATSPNSDEALQCEFGATPIDEIAIFSDGLERLALHMASQTAYAPFFRPMFTPLRASAGGASQQLCEQLEKFLSSDRVSERTDDDKTLIIASRRGPTSDSPTESKSDDEE